MYGGENLLLLPIITPMNYITKGRKYLMLVGLRKVGCLVDKERINFIQLFFMLILFFLAVF